MYKKLRFVLSLLHQLLFYASAVLTFSALLDSTAVQERSLLLLIPVFISGIFVQKFSAIWQLLLLHAAFLLLPLIWSKSFEEAAFCEIFLIVLFFVHAVESRSYSRRRTISDPSAVSILLLLPMALFNEAAHGGSLTSFFLVIMLAELLIYILDKFLDNMSEFVSLHRRTADMPLRQMERVDHGLIIIFLVLVVAVILLCRVTRLDRILAIIPEFLLWLLRILLSIFSLGLTVDQNEDGSYQVPENLAPPVSGEPSRFWVVLGQIVGVIVFVTLAIVILVALYRFLASRLNRREDNADKREFLKPFQQEEDIRGERKKDALSWRDFSPSGQVRRTYIRTILKAKGKKQQLSASHTPAELEASVRLADSEANARLHTLYEKARYSKDGCRKEEWEHYRRFGM